MLSEHFPQLLIVHILAKVLHEHIGESPVGATVSLGALASCHETAHVDLLVVQQHVVDVLDGLFSGLVGLEVNKAVASAVHMLVGHDLAGQDVAER